MLTHCPLGTHPRIVKSSVVKTLHDIAVDLVLIDTQELLNSIAHNSIHKIDSGQNPAKMTEQ